MTRPTTTGELALQIMRHQATLFAEEVAQVGSDPEHVHDSRVATRRMRAALRLFEDVLPHLYDLDEELRWIAGRLGAVRDLDVQATRLGGTAEDLGVAKAVQPFVEWLGREDKTARHDFDVAFQSDRFILLLDRLRALDHMTPPPEGDVAVQDDAPHRLRRAYRKLHERADDLCFSSPPEAYHRARIGAKRLRYAAEFFEPYYGKPARRLIDAVTDIQDVLGDHQDGIVDTRRIHDAARSEGSAWPVETTLALGQLIRWEAQHGQALRKQFKPLYRDVKSAWRRLKRDL